MTHQPLQRIPWFEIPVGAVDQAAGRHAAPRERELLFGVPHARPPVAPGGYRVHGRRRQEGSALVAVIAGPSGVQPSRRGERRPSP